MKSKILSFVLLCALSLTACAAPAEEAADQSVPAESISSQSEPVKKTPEEDNFAPSGQNVAIDAYSSILRSFDLPRPENPENPGYPEEFADAYIGEDNFLYVCLTDTSEEVLERYRGAVPEPRILRFVKVEHSYNDLFALHMALVEIEGLDFSYIGVDVTGNEVDIGIPDIGKEAEDRELIEKSLPEDVRSRFEDLPIIFAEEAYATFG